MKQRGNQVEAQTSQKRSGSETRQATKRFTVRLTPQQHEQFTARMTESGYDSVAAFVLARCLGPGQGPGGTRSNKLDRQELARAVAQLGKYGSNVNQIARAANSGGDPVRADQVHEIADQVREISAMVMKALGR